MSQSGFGFKLGHAKVGGRVKGTPNKKTQEQVNRIESFFATHWEEMETEIWPQLSPKEKKDLFVSLMNYRYPRLTSVDVKAQQSVGDTALEMLREAVQDSNII